MQERSRNPASNQGWLAGGGEGSTLYLKAKVQNFAQIEETQLFTLHRQRPSVVSGQCQS